MPRVLVNESGTKIGAYTFPDRKKPALCVEKGNSIVVYGSFRSIEAANKFMHELAVMIGANED